MRRRMILRRIGKVWYPSWNRFNKNLIRLRSIRYSPEWKDWMIEYWNTGKRYVVFSDEGFVGFRTLREAKDWFENAGEVYIVDF